MSCEYATTNLVASAKDTKTHSRSLVEWANEYGNTLKKYPDFGDFEESVNNLNEKMNLYNECHKKVAEENIRKVTTVNEDAAKKNNSEMELNKFAEELKSLHAPVDKVDGEKIKKEEEENEEKNLLLKIQNFYEKAIKNKKYEEHKEDFDHNIFVFKTSQSEDKETQEKKKQAKKNIEELCKNTDNILSLFEDYPKLQQQYDNFFQKANKNYLHTRSQQEVIGAWNLLTNKITCENIINS